MKKLIALVLAAMLCMTACIALAADLKIGAVMLGDETEGYTLAHMEGIKQAAAELGLSDSIVWKYKVPEDQTCYDSALDLVGQGCNLIISNSYGHQSYMALAAEEYPDVTFVAMTGDFAALSGLDNFKNAFTKVYQSRYVSGVVAGMKIAEMLGDGTLSAEKQPNSFDADGNVKIGYVGAYNYAEVISGYTAFFLGVRSIVPNVTMEVMYTNSWFDIDKEGAAAEALVAKGCVIIGQHADSTGAPSAVQAKYEAGETVFSVGYNIDMLSVAPDVALTSPQNNWGAYYTYAFEQVMNGKKPEQDWCHGYSNNAVQISPLGKACAAGTQEAVDAAIEKIKSGELKVFDCSTFTVNGEHLTSYDKSHGFEGTQLIWDGYFHESEVISAPLFDIRIDGITELSK